MNTAGRYVYLVAMVVLLFCSALFANTMILEQGGPGFLLFGGAAVISFCGTLASAMRAVDGVK